MLKVTTPGVQAEEVEIKVMWISPEMLKAFWYYPEGLTVVSVKSQIVECRAGNQIDQIMQEIESDQAPISDWRSDGEEV